MTNNKVCLLHGHGLGAACACLQLPKLEPCRFLDCVTAQARLLISHVVEQDMLEIAAVIEDYRIWLTQASSTV